MVNLFSFGCHVTDRAYLRTYSSTDCTDEVGETIKRKGGVSQACLGKSTSFFTSVSPKINKSCRIAGKCGTHSRSNELQWLPLTRALKGSFLRFKPAFWWTSINRYHGFSRVGLEKIPSPFEHSEEYVGVSAVFAIFYCKIWHRFMSRLRGEFVECLSEETQIIDIFPHCKLQPHKLSQSLATRLSSC